MTNPATSALGALVYSAIMPPWTTDKVFARALTCPDGHLFFEYISSDGHHYRITVDATTISIVCYRPGVDRPSGPGTLVFASKFIELFMNNLTAITGKSWTRSATRMRLRVFH